MAGTESICITGTGRLECEFCSRISPAFYPSCPTCRRTVFRVLVTEPDPVLIPFLASDPTNPRDAEYVIVSDRSHGLIYRLEDRGCFISADRTVYFHLRSTFNISMNFCNYLLGTMAQSGDIYYVDPVTNVNRAFMFEAMDVPNAPENTQAIRIVPTPPHITPDMIVDAGPGEKDWRPFVSPLFVEDRTPPPGAAVYCALCLTGNYDPGGVVVGPEGLFPDVVNADSVGMEAPESFRILPCGHEFHPACLSNWFRTKMRCPTCQVLVFTGDVDFDDWVRLNS